MCGITGAIWNDPQLAIEPAVLERMYKMGAELSLYATICRQDPEVAAEAMPADMRKRLTDMFRSIHVVDGSVSRLQFGEPSAALPQLGCFFTFANYAWLFKKAATARLRQDAVRLDSLFKSL